MAALDGAVALAEMDDVTVRVSEHLHLDVARIVEVPLDVNRRVGEVRLTLPPRRLERALDLGLVTHDLQPLPAAAGRGLDRERPPELVAEPSHLVGGQHRLGHARDDRDSRRPHPLARPYLGAHCLDRLGRRADPDDAAVATGTREDRILGEEPVARMDCLRARALRRREDALLIEVALGRQPTSDQIRLVGVGGVERCAVGLGVHGDRPDPELAQRPEDADRDLAAVCDQHFAENCHYPSYSLRR